MTWYEALLWLASLLGAVGAITAVIKKITKPFMDAHEQIESIAKDIKILRENDEDQYQSILRLTLMSPEIPVSERIVAGDKYIKRGGNGDCKHYYFELLKEHIK